MDGGTEQLLRQLEWSIAGDPPNVVTVVFGGLRTTAAEQIADRHEQALGGLDALVAVGLVDATEQAAWEARFAAAAARPQPRRLDRRHARALRRRVDDLLAAQRPDAAGASEVLHDLWQLGLLSDRRFERASDRLPAPDDAPRPGSSWPDPRADGEVAVRAIRVPDEQRGGVRLAGLVLHDVGIELAWEQAAESEQLAPPALRDDLGRAYPLLGFGTSERADVGDVRVRAVHCTYVGVVPPAASALVVRFAEVEFELPL